MTDSFYIRALFVFFSFFWILLVIVAKLYDSFAAMILLIPFGYFIFGICNSNIINDKNICDDVFSLTFTNTCLILSLQIINYIKNTNCDEKINTSIYMTMFLILLSYPHVWCSLENRIYYKICRSCLETLGVTLYIYSLTLLFFSDKKQTPKI